MRQIKAMFYLIFSIICSVSVGIIFKISRRYEISMRQIVAWNYVIALTLCYLFYNPEPGTLSSSAPWGIYVTLGLLMPSIFLILAASVKHMGIVKTDAAQRLSLFLPLLASWLLFGEHFVPLRILGLVVGFAAIVLILFKTEKEPGKTPALLYPVLVFIGFGLIDVLFKQIAQILIIPYTTSLVMVFCISFIVSLLGVAYLIFIKKEKFQFINFICGCILGFFNFGNILFYLKAHKALASEPSTVFTTMNMGVIILGSLVGIFIFKERLNKLNYIGLFMALAAIVFITLSSK